MFVFEGNAVWSKSWLNRAQVIRYFNPHMQIDREPTEFDSQSEDIIALKKAIAGIGYGNEFELGLGGTSLRFFAFLVSRLPGEWILRAEPKLLQRPQAGLIDLLSQLGVKAELHADHLSISSVGWNVPDLISTSGEVSSQFLSGLFLSAWQIDSPLRVMIKRPVVSYDYLKMTLNLLRQSGMEINVSDEESHLLLKIPAGQRASVDSLVSEPDVSSIFSLAAAAVVNGDACVQNWSAQSTQPDISFVRIFDKMGISFASIGNVFKIAKHNTWKGLLIDLNNSPDLFPVLAVLCALGEGVSRLSGAAHLKVKESDRIKKTNELLNLCGFKTEVLNDGLVIFGRSSVEEKSTERLFDPDHDHRMAMAAGILKLAGFNLKILTPEVVDKSYPNFWKDIGL